MTPIQSFSVTVAILFAAVIASPSLAQTAPDAATPTAKPKPKPKPAAAKPTQAKPAAATPTAQPAAPKPATAKPVATKPAVKPPVAAKPTPSKPAAAKPAPAKPAAATAPAPSAPGDDQPVLLGKYGEWGAYSAKPGGAKICFALGKPGNSQTTPPNRPRDPATLFISSRPAEKVKDEVSIIIGYSFKPNSEATLDIGPATFPMYTQNDGAWIKNAGDEAKMVEAMRKGSDAVIKGTSVKGTQTTDTFTLKGLAQAIDRIDQECK
jgi:hypothetical protein